MGLAHSTFRPLLRHVALVAVLAFIGLRLADAHLHVCLDGAEAPVTVHTANGPEHTYDDAHHFEGKGRSDQDIKLFDAALLKAGLDTGLCLLAVMVFFIPLMPRSTDGRAESWSLPLLKPSWRLRPPLRGPPL